MKNALLRVAAIALIVAGIAGLVFCIAGIVVLGRVQTQVETMAAEQLAVAGRALGTRETGSPARVTGD